jgi:threonine synthase
MSAPNQSFETAIDTRHDASASIVLRYRNALRFDDAPDQDEHFRELLARTSIAEGVRIVPLLEYRDVQIDVLDESSRMHTRTLKSIDGCVTSARCLMEGIQRVVFESGGNTGTALAAYATRLGIEAFCFVPEENLSLLDSRFFSGELTHLIAVADPGMVRDAVEHFERQCEVPRIPKVAWRISASEFIGCFVLEQLIAGRSYDHLVQSISAGFGPIGIYRVLERHRDRIGKLPRFLGVQQAPNSTMVQAWKAGTAEIPAAKVRSTSKLLSRVMYDATPQRYGTFEALKNLLAESGGHLTTIDHAEFDKYLSADVKRGDPLKLLAHSGVDITRRDGEVLEKTGLMALAGTFKQIDAGEIAGGSRVLCCLTGGTGKPDGRVMPELRIHDLGSVGEELRDRWLQQVSNRPNE